MPVSNKQEDAVVGSRYKERSVAEQKSLDLGLGLLMQDRFKDLLSTVCGTPEELSRFRYAREVDFLTWFC
jgi:hypothetical protein